MLCLGELAGVSHLSAQADKYSGDDHDYCEHRHTNGVREVTLKSFSSSTGIRKPGFQLLSLVPPAEVPFGSRTHADRPCFLPDQLGVYNRVYLPLLILTICFLFFTNIRTAWQRWKSGYPSVEAKIRQSPAFPELETMPNSGILPTRRVSDRPVTLTLPTRKSSQHLAGMTSTTPRSSRFHVGGDYISNRPSLSAPVSPAMSPRMSFSDDWPSVNGHGDPDGNESVLDTPTISRRSSYIYMNGPMSELQQTPTSIEPSSYFLPIPSNGGTGLGLSASTSPAIGNGNAPNLRRVSSSNLSASFTAHGNNLNQIQTQAPNHPGPLRRVTMPRMMSTSDWSAAAKAKEKSVFGLMVDSLPGVGGGGGVTGRRINGNGNGWDKVKGFARWLWKSRNGVVGKSWRECLAVAWPPGVVWVLVNGLFFIS